MLNRQRQAVWIARQQRLPGAIGHEVKLLEHDRPDQRIGSPRFDDRGEDARAALDLQLDVTHDRLALPPAVGESNHDLPCLR